MGAFHFYLLSLIMGLVFVAVCAEPLPEGNAEPESGAEPESTAEAKGEPEKGSITEQESNAGSLVCPRVFTTIVSLFAYAMFK